MRHLMAAAACKAIIAVREAFTHVYTASTDDKKEKSIFDYLKQAFSAERTGSVMTRYIHLRIFKH